MPTTPLRRALARVTAACGVVLLSSPLAAQPGASGSVEGRVLNAVRGDYLNNARIVVKGTSVEALTDNLGQYWLTGVPAGTVTLNVFYTGLATREVSVVVTPGQTAHLDIELAPAAPEARGERSAVTLEAVVVSSTRETDGAAIAINEQRFAPNLKNVIAAEEFGFVPEGNIGSFLRFVPGITILTASGDPGGIQLNGVPAAYTPITVGGFDLANASASSTSRQAQLDLASVNDVARVEVVQSPTPDTPGNALAGTVNLVPKTAFERSKPRFNYSTFLMGRTGALALDRTPGPMHGSHRKITPGADFSWIMPVNRRFGFTVSGSTTKRFAAQTWSDRNWAGTVFALAGTSPANPAMTDWWVTDAPNFVSRTSLSTSFDVRLTEADVITFSVQSAFFKAEQIIRQMEFSAGQQPMPQGNWGSTFTHGAAGMGSVRLNFSGVGNVANGRALTPTLTWRHRGPVWRAEAGAAYSVATNHYRDIDKGFFQNVGARRGLTPGASANTAANFGPGNRITVHFDDITETGPKRIGIFDVVTGAALDPANPSLYYLTGANARIADSQDERVSAYANTRRAFRLVVPVTVKAGLDFRSQRRDIDRNYTRGWTFLGQDGIANNDDDNLALYPVYDELFSSRALPYLGIKGTYVSPYKMWDLYRAHPEYFSTNEVTNLTNLTNSSRLAKETISSAYARGDFGFFRQRLRLVTGLRAEQTNVDGFGVRFDPALNTAKFPTNSVDYVRATRLRRGSHVKKEYLKLHPSLNLSYDVATNLIARAAYYRSIGRPDFGQYTSGLTLPDLANPPSPTVFITANNPNIKPWTSKSATLSLEYYFGKVGLLSVSVFQRDIDGFLISNKRAVTPEFLDAWALDNQYGVYEVSTQINSPDPIRFRGGQAAYKQSLTFLPSWARGVNVFANTSWQHASGALAESVLFSGTFVPFTANWGVSLGRERYSLRLNWNYLGRFRQGAQRPTGAYFYQQRRLYIDFDAEYYPSKTRRLGLFLNARNLRDQGDNQIEVMTADTPASDRLREKREYGVLLTMGLRGNF